MTVALIIAGYPAAGRSGHAVEVKVERLDLEW